MNIAHIHTDGSSPMGWASIRYPLDKPLDAFTAQCLAERFAKAWLPERLFVDGNTVSTKVVVRAEGADTSWSFGVTLSVIQRVSVSSTPIQDS